MSNENKEKTELLNELIEVRQRLTELEESAAKLKQIEEYLRKNLSSLSKKNRYETILGAITKTVHKSIKVQDVLENAVDSMIKNINRVDNVSIYIVEGKDAVLKAHRGYPDWFIERVKRIPYAKGFTWKTIIDGKPNYCTDVEKDKFIGPAGREVGTKSYASMPIQFEGNTVGAINIYSLKEKAFDKEELKLLEIVAQQIEKAFSNAKQAELLHKSEQRFRLVVDSAPNAIVMVDQEGKIKLINTQTEKLFGYHRGELIGQTIEILVPKILRGKHAEYRTNFSKNPAPRPMGFSRDLSAIRKDGTEFPVEIGLSPIQTMEGFMVLSSIVDISERKRAENELRKAKEKAQKYLDIAEVMLLAINDKQEVTMINKKGCKVLGYDEDEIIGKNWFDNFVPRQVRKKTREVFHKLMIGDIKSYEYHENTVLTKPGDERLIAWNNTVLTDDAGNNIGTLSSGVDITESKMAEKALRESEEKLQKILDNTTDAVLVYDTHGNILAANKEAERLFSRQNKKKLESIWDIIPSEDKDRFSEKLKSAKEGNKLLDYETKKILNNGERISVSAGLVYLKQDNGTFIETIRDIRERVAFRNKIVELEKAQVIGKMAEGVAHHMGTPLASMLLRVQMLKEDIPNIGDYATIMEKLESIERQIFYGQKVMQRLLKFANKPENEKRPEKISSIIDESLEIVRPLFKQPGIKLELSMHNDFWVLADVDLLELVLSDIMMNAIDAMPKGGKISLSVSNKTQKDIVEIAISDTGTGIPQDILAHVFEPFFSTKPAGKGTGLGLSVAKRIIHGHGGEISIESKEDEGTSVYIKIPIYTEGKIIEQV